MKVLITGGSGFVGQCAVEYLRKHHEITIFDKQPAKEQNVKFIQGDVQDIFDVRAAMLGQEAVVHMAAIPTPEATPPYKVLTVNAVGTFNTIDAAHDAGIPRYVYVSSESIYGLAYGATKRDIYRSMKSTPSSPMTLMRSVS